MKEKDLEKLKNSKLMKSIGVTDLKQDGGSVQLTLDPNLMPKRIRNKILATPERASAATLYNDPFDNSFYNAASDYNNLNVHDKIKLAMQWDLTDPLAGKILETMKIFANDGFRNIDTDEDRLAWYNNWGKTVDLEKVISWMFLEYFRSGNVNVRRKLIKVSSALAKIRKTKEVVEESKQDLEKGVGFRTKKEIPGAYIVLNPLSVYVKESNGFNEQLEIKNPDGTSDSVNTEEGSVSRVLRMRQPYEDYGRVLMERAFGPLYEKAKLRQMDLAVANSIINQLIIVTIGNDEFPATQGQLNKLARSFQNVGKSQTVFWNHTLKVELIKQDPNAFNQEKYERVDGDVMSAFGVADVLIGGATSSRSNYATSYISLKVFIANLLEARKEIGAWIEKQYAEIAETMGFDGYPKPIFSPLSLTDEIAEKQLIISLVDRGIISYRSAQERLGYIPGVERDRREKEVPLIRAGVLGFFGNPFHQSSEDEELVRDKDKDDDSDKNDDGKRKKKPKDGLKEMNRILNPEGGRPKGMPGKKIIGRKQQSIKGAGSEIEVENNITKEQVVDITREVMERLRTK